MRIEIIAVGTELATGNVVNINSSKIATVFTKMGFLINHHHVVKDDEIEIIKAFLSAFKRSDIIVFTGGLGPTFDDITKESIFKALNLEPVLNQKAFEMLKSYYNSDVLTDAEKKQAFIPEDVLIVPNDIGSAPGLIFDSEYSNNKRTIILLPGPTFEMETMLQNYVVSYLEQKLDLFCVSKTVKLCDITEVEVEKKIRNFIKDLPIEVGVYDKPSYVELTMTYRHSDKSQAEEILKQVFDKILLILKSNVINTNSKPLEEEVVALLKQKDLTVSFCESCTGGNISAKITSVPRSSSILKFSQVTYSQDKKISFSSVNEKILKEKTEVSQEVAGQMAIGTMKKTHSDFCVSVTGVAGPTRGNSKKDVGTVFIAVSSSTHVIIKRFDFNSNYSRKQIIELATNSALIMLFKFILNKDIKHGYLYTIGEFMKVTNQSISTSNGKNKNISNKKKIILNSILFLCFAVFIISIWEVGKYYYESYMVKLSNSNLSNNYNNSVESNVELPEGYLKKFSYLYSINKDVKGYLKINDTRIDYPIVQAMNNDYYLYKDFYGKNSRYGSIFYDYRADVKKPADNTVIYGHNIKDGQMFSDLIKYKDINFYKKNPTIQYDTVYEEGEYEVFAAILANVKPEKGEVFDYTNKLDFRNDKEFNDYIAEIKKRSVIDTGVNVVPGDKIITISTCDDVDNIDSRFAIFAKKIEKKSASFIDQQLSEALLSNELIEQEQKPFDILNKVESLSDTVNNNDNQNQTNSNISAGSTQFPQNNPSLPPQDNGSTQTPNINNQNGIFTFTTYGYGHGVGMSQYGANEYAKQGYDFSRILKHYYTGISIDEYSDNSFLKVSAGGNQREGSVVDIVSSVVTAEMGAHFHPEALKAQAIATHTYIRNANISGSVPYVPFKNADPNIIKIVKEVENKILTYGGNIVYTPYFALSSGMTQSSKDMWGGNYPWLSPVDSSVDRNVNKPNYYLNYKNEVKISASDLKNKIESNFNIKLSSDASNWFKDIVKNSSGYVISINIDDKIKLRGRDIREKLFTTQSFKSHAFDIFYSS